MSYLDLPRVHFSGVFRASPSTLNNTPLNYAADNWATPDDAGQRRPDADTELYWSPNGDGIFDLVRCQVSSIVAAPSDSKASVPDALEGQPVTALYTKAPPKIVDLDPMQQNVSEVWGLKLMIGDFGGAHVQGDFAPISFNGIWQVSQGENTPHSSASGSAIYQSTLSGLTWNASGSPVLEALQRVSPDRLSVRLVVQAHNNMPDNYYFSDQSLAASGAPSEVIAKLQSLKALSQSLSEGNIVRGLIPTEGYVRYLLRDLLGEQVANQYGTAIVNATAAAAAALVEQGVIGKPAPMPQAFNYGNIVGTIGPAGADEPTYAVPARTLAGLPTPPSSGFCWWGAAALSADRLTVDLANSLPVEMPGQLPWAEKLGTLRIGYLDSRQGTPTFESLATVDYSGNLMTRHAGVLDVDLRALDARVRKQVEGSPLALQGTPGGSATVLLSENQGGLSLRADQFVYRMNPGLPTTADFPRGNTATVRIYVRKYGRAKAAAGQQVSLTMMTEQQAEAYTIGTLGTSGTRGIANLSIPQDALTIEPAVAVVDEDGIATFTLTAKNPGSPRGALDGQVYFLQYALTGEADYRADPNDLVSVQVYTEKTTPAATTWENGIGEILSQYGRLYPVMGRFGLQTYSDVRKNRDMIEGVLRRTFEDAMHMPVTRDLSDAHRDEVLAWFAAGMKER